MRRSRTTIVAAGMTLALLAGGSSLIAVGSPEPKSDRSSHGTHAEHRAAASSKRFALRTQMRKLWEDHIVWTRQFIVSSVADLPDAGTAAERLLLNQEHIGNAIAAYYGEEAGDAVTALLKDHILIAADLLTAAKDDDDDAVAEASQRWDDNAVAIATFLSDANPRNWPADEMTSMMREHLDLTLAEAVARLNSDWDGDVAAYDEIHRQILHMADMVTRGIVRQFPKRF
jgi:hypothetical protein